MRLLHTMRLPLISFLFVFICQIGISPITLSAQAQLTFQIETETVKMGEEMCTDIIVQDFNLLGFQFTISWDSSILNYTRVIDPQVPYFFQSSYQDFPNMFRVAWINENITNTIVLPNSSPVFTLCFTPKKPGRSNLFFDQTSSTPLHPEFIDLGGELNATLIDGAVMVLGCTARTTEISQTICAGSSYEGYDQAGQYTETFLAADGCDSTRILNLSVSPSIQSTVDRTICAGSTFEGYSQSGQYTNAFTSYTGCDSIRILNLFVVPSIATTINQTICSGTSYEGYSQAGQYTDTYTSYTGCDSIRTLNLTVVPSIQATITQSICSGTSYEGYSQSGQYTDTFIAPSGCDSTRTLLLTVTSAIETTLNKTICEGENYGGRVQQGNYRDTYTSVLTGCDSTRSLNLTVLPPSQSSLNRTICEGSCLTMNGVDYCNEGTYSLNLTSAAGCDSTLILTLQVTEQVRGNSVVQMCPGEFWIEGGTALEEAGTYNFMYASANGCDSLHTLTLSFFELEQSTSEAITICEGENFGGRTLPGTYTDNYTSVSGCDSSHTITLTVLASIEKEVTISICEGQTHASYTQSGRYIDSFTASNGCDSIRILNLTVSNSIQTTLDVSICEGQLEEGYSQSGQYIDSYTSNSGCDSTRILNLTVASTIRNTISAIICEGEDFEGLTATGIYENTFTSTKGCDSIRALTLTVLPNVETIIETSICQGEDFEGFTNAGTYTNILTRSNGCDSIRTITLSILPADDVSCSSTPTIDISSAISVAYYPNPVQTQLFVEWNADVPATYSILNLSGQTLHSESSKGRLSSLNLSTFTAGIYYLKIDTEKGSHFGKLLKL